MSWLDDLLDHTAEVESPRSWVLWAALASIAAIKHRDVWLDKQAYKLYPNLYVMLMGKSGLRKSFPIYCARTFVAGVGNTRVIDGQVSIQGMIKDLSLTASSNNGKPMITTARCILLGTEFSDLIIDDPSAIKTLTNLYDNPFEWKRMLRNSDPEVLKEPSITLLGASNEELFRDYIPEYAYKGGFVGRLLIVEETKKRVKNSLTKPFKVKLDIPSFIPYLRTIECLKGPFTWPEDCRELFDSWYQKFDTEEREDPTGMIDRIHDGILKVAMCCSLARAPDLVLSVQDLTYAFTLCEKMIKNAVKIALGEKGAEIGELKGKVLKYLILDEKHSASRTKIMSKFYGQMQIEQLDTIVGDLAEGKVLDLKYDPKEGMVYRLTDEWVRVYEENVRTAEKQVKLKA